MPEQIAKFDVFAEHEEREQHAERRHQEMIGASSCRATHFQEMKPEQIGQDRSAEHEERERGEQARARHDVADVSQRERKRQQHDACGKILHAVADPQAALRRQHLEQDGAGDDRGQRRQREYDAVPAIRADRHAVPDDEADAGDAEQKPDHLAPGQRLAKEHRRKHSREDRIGADDQAADAGRYGLEPGIAEAEIERVVGDAEDREDAGIAPRQRGPRFAAQHSDAEDQDAGKRKSRREQDQRRAISDADLAGDEGKAPEQAEQADIERQRIEAGAGNRDRGGERHGKSPLPMI